MVAAEGVFLARGMLPATLVSCRNPGEGVRGESRGAVLFRNETSLGWVLLVPWRLSHHPPRPLRSYVRDAAE